MTTKTAPRYRWSHPSEWLDHHMSTMRADRLESIARQLAGQLDGDQIQDLFQDEMDADGYFHDLNTCPDCESALTSRTTSGGHPSYCDECDCEVNL